MIKSNLKAKKKKRSGGDNTIGGQNIPVENVDVKEFVDELGVDSIDIEESSVTEEANSNEEEVLEEKIRPSTFDEIIGRKQEKKTLKMMIDAASKKNRVVDHILFYGPPGLGKTTFAMAMSKEIGSNLRITSGPAIERQGDLAAILTNLKTRDILFIDEIHRLSRGVEEILYPALEDGVLDIVMGKGPSAKTIRLNLEPFTLVGATTQIGKISSPLRDRFGYIQRLDYFTDEELAEIVNRAANIDGVNVEAGALSEIAQRARGTGRIALRLFRRVRDYYESEHEDTAGDNGILTHEMAVAALDLLGVDKYGLEAIERRLLKMMLENYGGGPVGLSTLSASVSEEVQTLSDVYEPFLLKCGLIKRTAKGRVLTQKGHEYASYLLELIG